MELHSVEAIISALNSAGAEYLIVDGLAVNAHGFVRLTRDVDIVIRLTPGNARTSLSALFAIGYRMSMPETPEAFEDAGTRERWRLEKQMVVLKLWSDEHARTPVDIFIYEPFSFEEELARRVLVEIGPGIVAPVVGLATLLELKRGVGRPQDLIDVQELERLR
jgi:hypothetical protein